MNYAEEKERAKDFFNTCLTTLTKKANDYASDQDVFSNFKKISVMSNVPTEKIFIMFMTVKLARIVELLDKTAKNESLSDSLMDLSNYACLMSMYLNAKRKEE